MIETTTKYAPLTRQNGSGQEQRWVQKHIDRSTVFDTYRNLFFTGRLKDVPEYRADSRARDKWLQTWRLQETLMAGAMNSVVLIDANRGWSITGGRNQVRKWTSRIKNDSAMGEGWRWFAKKASLSFWSTDMGNVVGTRREPPFAIQSGDQIMKTPLLALENIDPAQCRIRWHTVKDLSDEVEGFGFEVPSKLMYKSTPLFDWDYFRVASMIQDSEEFRDLGFCALSRALEFTRIMFAVWMHDLEMLDAKMPKGLLLLQGIDEDQWDTAMQQRDQELTAKQRQYYGGLEVFTGVIAPQSPNVDAKIVALSQLPSGWDSQAMTQTMMLGYALCFGIDPAEIWPTAQGSFGTSEQSRIQAEKATSKGQGDWALSFQENLQRELPPTVHFEFQERNVQGEKEEAELDKTKAEVLNTLAGIRENSEPLYTNEQLMEIAVKLDLADPEWTDREEPVTATDEGEVQETRQRLLEIPKIRNACEQYQDEPIVRYTWNSKGNGKEEILWASGWEAIKRQVWPVTKVLYQGKHLQLTTEDFKLT